MKLYEFQAKELFKKYGILTPKGKVVENIEDVSSVIKDLEERIVLKAQVQVGGRGKAGGIKVVNKNEAIATAKELFNKEIKGLPINMLLIENAINIDKEYYLSITLDRSKKRYVVMLSAVGGVDIEEIAEKTPEKLLKVYINPLIGLQDFQINELVYNAEFESNIIPKIKDVIFKLYKLFKDYDCSLAEINPLVLTKEGDIYAADGKIDIDDNALFRQKDLEVLKGQDEDILENEAKEFGLSFVKLDGNIGCIVNGAGLAMATMDGVKYAGGQPANFLDIGGSSNPEKVIKAIEIILSNPNIKAILLNIFGGITRCDDVANGLIVALNKLDVKVPIVVRLTGTNEKEAIEILEKENIKAFSSMKDAIERVVKIANT